MRIAAPRPARRSALADAIRTGFGPLAWVGLPAFALAAPQGGEVVAGQAAIASSDPSTTTITQSTGQAILRWQSFSIDAHEHVQFVQPDTRSIALNRVVGGNPSAILGSLRANGQVFLVNPRGVYFGPGSTVDVGGLVASVHDIADEDFLAQRYRFSRGPEGAGAGVVNDGVITVRDGGYVVLIGEQVANHGVIEARLGSVVLAAGSRMTLDVEGDGLVSFAIDEAALGNAAGVQNTGALFADGGRVLMSAKVASDLAATAVNNSGLVQARSVVEQPGGVFLLAGGGDVAQSGTVDVSGAEGAAGGRVIVRSDRDVILANGGAIHADGDGAGNGGQVRVIANGHLAVRPDAHISARGGEGAERGGFVEVSGHGSLALRGIVELGPQGHLLIDPTKLLIKNDAGVGSGTAGGGTANFVTKGFIEGQLDANVDVTLLAASTIGTLAGTLGPVPSITATGTGNLAILIGTASSDVGTASLAGFGGAVPCGGSAGACQPGAVFGFSPVANGTISLSAVDITVRGDVTLDAPGPGGTIIVGHIDTQDGDVSLTAPGGVTAGNILTANGAATVTATNGVVNVINVTAPNGVTVTGSSVNVANVLTTLGSVTISASGPLNGLNVSADSGGVALAGSTISVNHVTAAGSVSINASGGLSAGNLSGSSVNVNVSGSATMADVVGGNVAMSIGGSASVNLISASSVGLVVGGPFNAAGRVAGANGVSVQAGGIAINGPVTAVSGGVSLSATNGDLFANNVTASGSVSLNASSGTLTAGNVTSTFGNVSIFGSSGLSVGNVSAASGTVGLSVGSGSLSAGNIVTGGGLQIGSSSSPISGQIAIGTVNAQGNVFVFGSSDVTTGLITATSSQVSISGGGDVTVGGVSLTSTGNNASVNLFASGDLLVTGPVTVTVNGAADSATFNATAFGDLTLNGPVNVTANGVSVVEAIVSINGTGSGTVTVNGNVTAKALNGSAQLDVNASSTGDITVNGNLSALGTEALIRVRHIGSGDILVNGNLVATGNSASIDVSGSGTMTFNGNLTATATTNDADVDIRNFGGNIAVNGNVLSVGAESASASIVADSGNITLNGNVSIGGGTDEHFLDIRAPFGSIFQAAGRVIQVNGAFDGSGNIRVLAGGAITLNGRIAVVTQGSDANIDLSNSNGGAGGIKVGRIDATANGADVEISITDGGTGPIILGPIVATAIGGDASLAISDLPGDPVVGVSGTFFGDEVDLTGPPSGADFTVITKTPDLDVANARSLSVQNLLTAPATFTLGAIAGGFTRLRAESLGNLTIDNAVTVGSGFFEPLDPGPVALISPLGIAIPPTGFNATFEAGGALALPAITMTGTYPVLTLGATSVTFGGPVSLPAATDFLVALDGPTPFGNIGIESLSTTPGACGGVCSANFFNNSVFSQFPGTTIVVGAESFVGTISIGENGPVDIGSKNFIALAPNGSVQGLGNIISTGIVASIVGDGTIFEPPVPTEFAPEEEDDGETEEDEDGEELAAGEDESGEGGEGACSSLVCEESNAEALDEADAEQCS